MPENKVIELFCKCGKELARYRKEGKGHLIKMFLRNILVDRAGVFLKTPPLPNGSQVNCPSCEKRVATIQMIHGEPAAKLNQGAIKQVNT